MCNLSTKNFHVSDDASRVSSLSEPTLRAMISRNAFFRLRDLSVKMCEQTRADLQLGHLEVEQNERSPLPQSERLELRRVVDRNVVCAGAVPHRLIGDVVWLLV